MLKEPVENLIYNSFWSVSEVNHVYCSYSNTGPNKLHRWECLTKIKKPEIPNEKCVYKGPKKDKQPCNWTEKVWKSWSCEHNTSINYEGCQWVVILWKKKFTIVKMVNFFSWMTFCLKNSYIAPLVVFLIFILSAT